jgi:hypothetical protein
MLALILWFTLGSRAAMLELIGELVMCVMLYSGGGGKRIRRTARHFADQRLRLRATVPA